MLWWTSCTNLYELVKSYPLLISPKRGLAEWKCKHTHTQLCTYLLCTYLSVWLRKQHYGWNTFQGYFIYLLLHTKFQNLVTWQQPIAYDSAVDRTVLLRVASVEALTTRRSKIASQTWQAVGAIGGSSVPLWEGFFQECKSRNCQAFLLPPYSTV